ncbi:MAG: bifunctional adenosylcobinamide kinase/adenosylcobinamide-phosphate guanylyltransferase [Desulfovibrionaceae bacterium]|nr:bifunctional adenosylcobinamide kinase/adenosylcobinamide-phosphate guanylyltransferase [Desulfovibrionaceae bacterium]MDD4952697.1 bifunctional adenosylcobinamide kinase/adenosylcobinamide-phosphate guanylyltransferase [Desulfovibrionaceae bacterium]
MITLILGGNKSGKSAFGLRLMNQAPGPRILLATGRAKDLPFRRQILEHRERRSPDIPVLEVGLDLPRSIIEAKEKYGCVLADSLDFWLFACRESGCGRDMVQALLDCLSGWDGGELILVSCEIGFSPLPATAEARGFVKALGELHQQVADLARTVYFVAAGLPLALKKA